MTCLAALTVLLVLFMIFWLFLFMALGGITMYCAWRFNEEAKRLGYMEKKDKGLIANTWYFRFGHYRRIAAQDSLLQDLFKKTISYGIASMIVGVVLSIIGVKYLS